MSEEEKQQYEEKPETVRNPSPPTPPRRSVTPPPPTAEPSAPFVWHDDGIMAVAWMPDGKRVVSGSNDRSLRVWNAETGGKAMDPLLGHTDEVNAISISPDGRRIASGADDHTIRVWDAYTGELVLGPLRGHTDWVMGLIYSPDGRLLASAGGENEIRIWKADSGELVRVITGHTEAVRSVCFSPDSRRLVSGANDNTLRIWDVSTGECILPPFEGHSEWIRWVVYSPNGRTVIGPLTGHDEWIGCIAYSPDGGRLASCSHDKTLRVWDANTGALLIGPLYGHTDVLRALAFSPDGTKILTGSLDRTLRIWDATTGKSRTKPQRAGSTDSFLDMPATAIVIEAPRMMRDMHSAEPEFIPRVRRPLRRGSSESFDSILDLPATDDPGADRKPKKKSKPPVDPDHASSKSGATTDDPDLKPQLTPKKKPTPNPLRGLNTVPMAWLILYASVCAYLVASELNCCALLFAMSRMLFSIAFTSISGWMVKNLRTHVVSFNITA
ncbi:WD40-repeat-containing domain protein [Hygrophoropsis aurantiaca]|uniref:WD40-repeat-containing domain protein n=1 Tax=Hygrophoropsis aurantiaca TaxID=72124 RepID=A0ACB8AJT0_9AGAM|nr:WD40-repeat-containing domain protein [Hygrophoropsis aurantiaca]